MRIVAGMLLLLSVPACSRSHPPATVDETVTPFFSAALTSPAFYIECVNQGAPAEFMSDIWPSADHHVRVDGQVIDEKGGGIATGGGLVPTGGRWRGIIELQQAGEYGLRLPLEGRR